MGVNLWEGNNAKRLATALETVAEKIDSMSEEKIQETVDDWFDDHPSSAQIDDTSTANNKVWSAQKTNNLLSAIQHETFVETHNRWHEDNVPYVMRASGGGVSVHDWERDTLIGGTVAWNQLNGKSNSSISNNGIDISFDKGTGLFTVVVDANPTGYAQIGIPIDNPIIIGHKYIALSDVSLPSGIEFYNARLYGIRGSAQAPGNKEVIQEAVSQIEQYYVYLYVAQSTASGTYNFKIRLHDLTAMFGSTIADYIYTLETGTAGAGVAWFRNLFPNDYYAYDAGSLQSVNAEAHKTVGFNLFDEDAHFTSHGFTKNADGSYSINDYYNLNGVTIWENTLGYTGRICVSYKYKYQNGTGSSGLRIKIFYDDGSNVTTYPTVTTSLTDFNAVSTDGKKVEKIVWDYGTSSNGTTFVDFCINLSDASKNGTYEPYVSNTYPLGNIELRGIPKLDANNKLYYDGDVYRYDGSVTRKYGIVDLGTVNYYANPLSNGRVFFGSGDIPVKIPSSNDVAVNAFNGIFTPASFNATWKIGDMAYWEQGVKKLGFVVADNAYVDPDAFKTAMSGVYLVYELATPTETTSDPFADPQAVSAYGTEEYVDRGVNATTPTRDVSIPVGHETKYVMDAFQYVEEKLAELE